MFCTQCGTKNEPGSAFCTNCNNNLMGDARQAEGFGVQRPVTMTAYTQSQADETVTVGDWIITTLILLVPFVNLIMMFVWAFGSNTKPSKANYFKAYLLLCAILVGFYILLAIVFGAALFGSFME